MSLPTFNDAKNTASDAIRTHGRTLIPWLPHPPLCDCGAMKYASITYDPTQVAYVTSWKCRECNAPDTHRNPVYGPSIVQGPSPGAANLRELLIE